MIGASREALAAGRENLESLTDNTSVDAAKLAEELASVTDLLDREVSLRRVLTDPSRSGQDKAGLVGSLLAGQVSGETIDLVSGLVRSRWSGARDLVDSVEQLSAYAEVIAADKAGKLDDLEDELFRFGRVVSGSHELRSGLTEPKAGTAAKAALVKKLLGGRALPATVRLVTSLVSKPRGRSLDQGLESYSKLAADRRDRVVALVTTAVPLSDTQRARLEGALGRLYGRAVLLNIDVDPTVVGGVRVQIGDEIIDGTVSSRLEGARQALES
ncbi:F-type H+-transporting ATPase subunit delta [Kitasatospora sp. MAP12-15]|uniref:F0F1 ATP synthase subunit delta n=1 Tax=unclassified Kitasatospora TaxID=2633591 RepID=UPI0024768571|nr:F0F1 ATP synthase subunit delta [Kitasatospora sp. MAP12-44]MDH6112816.1 F-type H+-transporting ATPase subunit delta [Kitasatospora sp. MAP12-44]